VDVMSVYGRADAVGAVVVDVLVFVLVEVVVVEACVEVEVEDVAVEVGTLAPSYITISVAGMQKFVGSDAMDFVSDLIFQDLLSESRRRTGIVWRRVSELITSIA
jgi:hypothetical protein